MSSDVAPCLSLTFSLATAFASVEARIRDKDGITPDRQRLIFASEQFGRGGALSDYERQRLANIAGNQRRLQQLGLA